MTLTPDHEDMAFVLETVPGVRGVYAVSPRAGVDDDVTLVVHVEIDKRCVAAAHYALLKIIKHEDCRRVAIVENLPPKLEHRMQEIRLSSTARFAAMNRVSTRARALAEERLAIVANEKTMIPTTERERSVAAVLVFSKDPSLGEIARQAFPFSTIETTSEFGVAVKTAKYGHHGLVLCPAAVAFGVWGFLECVSEHRPALAQEVVLVADERERDVVAMGLAAWQRSNRCLFKPVTVESLRLVNTAPLGHEVVNVPLLTTPPDEAAAPDTPAKGAALPPVTRRAKPIVLLVDDEPDTESLPAAMSPSVHVIRVSSEWDALDRLALSEIDLVICNASMTVTGGRPLYRLLWNVRPELKKVCALIIEPHRVPASARDGRTSGAITRPITSDMIRALLAR